MRNEVTNTEHSDALFSDLALALKTSGLHLEEKESDIGLTEEERLVLAYLRHRVQTRVERYGVHPPSKGPAVEDDNHVEVPDDRDVAAPDTPAEEDAAPELVVENAVSPDGDAGEEVVVAEDAKDAEPVAKTAADHTSEVTAKDGVTGAVLQNHRSDRPISLKPPMQWPRAPERVGLLADAAEPDDAAQEAAAGPGSTAPEEAIMPKGISGIPKVGQKPVAHAERFSLPNAKANTRYEAHIEGYTNLRMRDDGGSGLILHDDGAVSSHGMPAGEYKLDVGGLKSGSPVSIVVRLSVIPRPQDLWTSIPSDQDAPFAKADQDFKMVEGEALLVAASKRGRSHAKEGGYRDDDFGLAYLEASGWHVMVVADGAGSAPLSREGSRVACRVALHALETYLSKFVDPVAESMVKKIVGAKDDATGKRSKDVLSPVINSLMRAAHVAAQKLEERATQIQCRAADLSTTLSIACAKRVAGRWLLLSFSIGDGGVGVWDGETGEVALMCDPDSGEYAGQTRFLAMDELGAEKDRAARVFAEVRDDFTAFMAMTDGITDPKFETDAALGNAERWRTFWEDDLTQEIAFSRKNDKLEREFLDWMDFWSRGNHDDRTLAVMVLRDIEKAAKEKEAIA